MHRRDTLRATKIYHEPLMRAENVEFLWNSTVAGFYTDGGEKYAKIVNVASGEERMLTADAVFVSIGRTPETSLFHENLALDAGGYIVADETTRTNIDGVFAVGDVRTKALRQVVTAVADGAVAAHFAEEYLSRS